MTLESADPGNSAPRRRSLLVPAILATGFLAGVAGIYLLVTMTVKWPEPLPWEDGTPYLARVPGGTTLEPGDLILLGPDVVGRVMEERPRGPELATLRIRRTLRLTRDTRFTLREIDGRRTILLVPGARSPELSPWDEVRVELRP